MKIKFVKGKRKGETREVSPAMAEFFCKIRQEAIILKIADGEIKTKERGPVQDIPETPKRKKG
jgi:hypothetical protein